VKKKLGGGAGGNGVEAPPSFSGYGSCRET